MTTCDRCGQRPTDDVGMTRGSFGYSDLCSECYADMQLWFMAIEEEGADDEA